MWRPRSDLSASLGAVMLAAASALAPADPGLHAEPTACRELLQLARHQLEDGHYAQAWQLYARLADCGHPEGARVALQMRAHGKQLYGQTFTAGPQQLARWRAQLRPHAPAPTHCPAPGSDDEELRDLSLG